METQTTPRLAEDGDEVVVPPEAEQAVHFADDSATAVKTGQLAAAAGGAGEGVLDEHYTQDAAKAAAQATISMAAQVGANIMQEQEIRATARRGSKEAAAVGALIQQEQQQEQQEQQQAQKQQEEAKPETPRNRKERKQPKPPTPFDAPSAELKEILSRRRTLSREGAEPSELPTVTVTVDATQQQQQQQQTKAKAAPRPWSKEEDTLLKQLGQEFPVVDPTTGERVTNMVRWGTIKREMSRRAAEGTGSGSGKRGKTELKERYDALVGAAVMGAAAAASPASGQAVTGSSREKAASPSPSPSPSPRPPAPAALDGALDAHGNLLVKCLDTGTTHSVTTSSSSSSPRNATAAAAAGRAGGAGASTYAGGPDQFNFDSLDSHAAAQERIESHAKEMARQMDEASEAVVDPKAAAAAAAAAAARANGNNGSSPPPKPGRLAKRLSSRRSGALVGQLPRGFTPTYYNVGDGKKQEGEAGRIDEAQSQPQQPQQPQHQEKGKTKQWSQEEDSILRALAQQFPGARNGVKIKNNARWGQIKKAMAERLPGSGRGKNELKERLFPAIVVATGTHHGWDTFCIGVGVSIFTAAQMASWWTLALMYIQIAEVTKVQQKVGTQLSGKFRTIVIGVSATGAVGTLTFVMIERLDLLMAFALCCMLSTAILNAVGVRRLRKSLRFKSNEPMTRIYRKARLLGILLFFGFAFGVLNAAMIFFRPLGTTYMYHLGVMLSYWAFQIAVALAAAEVVLFVYQLEQGKMPRPDSGAFVLSNPMSSQQGLDLRTIKEEKSRDVSVNCLIIVMTHCTPILDELQGRRGIREAIKVTAAVSVAVGIICAIMFLRVTRALILVTCRHRRIHDRMEHRLWGNKQSAWKVGRLWQLIMLQISSGGRWFDLWEFLREFAEAVLQMLALGDYANSGLDRVWLDAYVCVLLVNSFSAIVLALPKALPALFGNQAPETRARRERFVLGLDVICDTFYTTFATVYFVLKLNSFLYGAAGEQLCADMGVQGLPCADAIGLVMAPVAQELHFGGHTFIGILFKFATRLGPLWFAAARAEEVFEVQAVARATRRRMQIPRQKKQLPRRKDKKKKQEMLDGLVGTGIFGNVELSVLDVESGDGAGAASADRRRTSWATQKLSREVDEVGRAIPVLVPRRFVAFFVIVVWSFCIFAWVRIALLEAPCRSDDPWKKYCRMHAHPIVDFNLPGNGCVVNTTHVEEIMDGFENLAVFALQLSPAIESLRLPAKSFKKLKMLSVLWLDGIQLDGGIPEEIAELHSSLTVLGLTNTGLTTVNPSLWKCTSLGIFYLSHNRLKELPPGMEKLTLLSVFGADNNRLTQLPNELGTLSHLGSLQVSNNLLTSLPRSFAQLQVLFRLSLSGNRFARVPLFGSLPWIWPQLQFLDLQDNNITVLPPTWQLHRDARVTEELDYQFHANGTWREPFEEPSWTPDRDCENWDKCDGWHVTDPRENDVPPLLIVLLGGNPVAQQQQQPPQLASNPLEQFRRNNLAGTMESDLPAIVAASGNASASCAPGCLDPEWGRLSPNLITFQVDGFCDIVCNTSACGYDGGDCQSKVKPRSGWPNERGDNQTVGG
eukprot:g2375.t1